MNPKGLAGQSCPSSLRARGSRAQPWLCPCTPGHGRGVAVTHRLPQDPTGGKEGIWGRTGTFPTCSVAVPEGHLELTLGTPQAGPRAWQGPSAQPQLQLLTPLPTRPPASPHGYADGHWDGFGIDPAKGRDGRSSMDREEKTPGNIPGSPRGSLRAE